MMRGQLYSNQCTCTRIILHTHTHIRVQEGDVVGYGQHVTMTTLPEEGGEVRVPHPC